MKNLRVLALACCMGALSCKESIRTKTPEKLNDGWEVASATEQGMKQKLVDEAMSAASENKKLDALIIVKDGKLVAEYYANGYDMDKPHKVWSVTKAVTATVTGIAIDKGLIHSEKDSMCRYLGGYEITQPGIKNITIEHLLTMTSGFAWQELGGPGTANFEMPYSNDWIAYTLKQPHTGPGKQFVYNTGSYMLFGAIIKNSTGMQADEFAEAKLFGPLGITRGEWDKQSEFWTKTKGDELKGAREPGPITYNDTFAAYSNTGSGLHMTARDMAKIGQLYLNRGKWKNQQLVSEQWIEKCTRPSMANKEYGYGWRISFFDIGNKRYNYYYASGFGQQAIFVVPALQLVAVFAQQHYDSMPEGDRLTNELLMTKILPAAL